VLRIDLSWLHISLTWLSIASLILMVLWAILRPQGKRKTVVLYVLAYLLLYVDYLVLKNHFNFEFVGIMIAIAAIVAVVQYFRNKRKVQPSKELAIYIFLSAFHGLLYLLVSV